jgi:hypothetical protein
VDLFRKAKEEEVMEEDSCLLRSYLGHRAPGVKWSSRRKARLENRCSWPPGTRVQIPATHRSGHCSPSPWLSLIFPSVRYRLPGLPKLPMSLLS